MRRCGIKFTAPDFLAIILLLLLPITALILSRWDQPAMNSYQAIAGGHYTDAFELLEQSVQDGDMRSSIHLGNLYRLGLGVSADYSKAASLYWQSAQLGDPLSMVNLGLMYRDGLGVRKDPGVAFGWFNLALGYHIPASQFYLSEMIVNQQVPGHKVQPLKQQYSTLQKMPLVKLDQ